MSGAARHEKSFVILARQARVSGGAAVVLRRVVAPLALSVAASLVASGELAVAQTRIEIETTRVLVVHVGDERVVIKTLSTGDEFQGSGFLDEKTVFFAYSLDEEEAGSVLAIYDLRDRRVFELGRLDLTGASAFVTNPDGSLVAFNWFDGIYVGSLRELAAQVRLGRSPTRALRTQFRRIVAGSCSYPRWVGPSRVRYTITVHGCSTEEEASVDPRRVEKTGSPRADPPAQSPEPGGPGRNGTP